MAEHGFTLLFQFTPLHERQHEQRVEVHGDHHFNSRLCMRGNQAEDIINFAETLFQFTPLHERQRSGNNTHVGVEIFQFTPLHERQHRRARVPGGTIHFNSRLCMRGNKNCEGKMCNLCNFNSRLCMRGNLQH